jgi:hypothetical protein
VPSDVGNTTLLVGWLFVNGDDVTPHRHKCAVNQIAHLGGFDAELEQLAWI